VVNSITNLAGNGVVAVGVYCCNYNAPVNIVGMDANHALQGIVDYSILSIYCIAFLIWWFNGAWAARDARARFLGMQSYVRPKSWEERPLIKFIADVFYVNDVWYYAKDCCGFRKNNCSVMRTIKKWVLHTLKSALFGGVAVLVCSPGLALLVVLDQYDVVQWNAIGAVILQILIGGILGWVLAPLVVMFAILRRKERKSKKSIFMETKEQAESHPNYPANSKTEMEEYSSKNSKLTEDGTKTGEAEDTSSEESVGRTDDSDTEDREEKERDENHVKEEP